MLPREMRCTCRVRYTINEEILFARRGQLLTLRPTARDGINASVVCSLPHKRKAI